MPTKCYAKVYIRSRIPWYLHIRSVYIVHKYSDVYKDITVLENIWEWSKGCYVRYNTGFLTTGVDWWYLVIELENGRVYVTDPGLGQAILNIFEQLVLAAAQAIGAAVPGAGFVGEIAQLMLNSESTDGFARHVLREEDDYENDTEVWIEIHHHHVRIRSNTGQPTDIPLRRIQ